MKIFALLVIFCVGFNGFAKELKDSTDIKLTKEVIYNDVKNALVQLGDALKVGAEHVYVVLVKQQVTKSVVNIVVFILLLITVIIGYNITRNTYKAHIREYQMDKGQDGQPDLNYYPDIEDSSKGILSIILCIITVILSIGLIITTLCNITETITGFTNPEYGAIKDIFDFIKAK